MGFFSSLDKEQYDRKYSDRELIRRILMYFKPHRIRMTMIVVLVLLLAGISVIQPLIVSRGVDLLKPGVGEWTLILLAGAVLVAGILNWAINWASRRLTVRTVAAVVLKMAEEGFQAATNHDLSFYDEVPSGKVVSRITSDTQDFGQLVTITTDVITQLVESITLAIILLSVDWRLTLYLFALIPVVAILTYFYRKLARKVTRQGMRAMANVNSTIKETISGIAVAKNFRQETSIYDEFDKANDTSYQVNFRRGLVLSIVFPTLNAMGGMATAMMIYAGAITVSQGLVTAGVWYLFITSLDRFLYPVMNLASFWTQIQNGLSAAERVFALIDAEPAVRQISNQPVLRLQGKIEFKHVGFSYKPDEPVLEDFNLHIRPGENIAIVGHTGAGKTSIAKLVARFYEYQSGEILIDDQDIRSFHLETYRNHLGIVTQVPFLFSGTVVENIRYARPDVTDDEIEQLARTIGEGEWLEALPDGLQTNVGERGSRLSMGQRQLVSLMRVLVQKPAIFILDEATASIDPFTEWQIQQTLKMILAQTTSILIAHRLSTVKSADRIIVMEQGRIIEMGNHDDLMRRGGHYAGLYNTYFRH
ncbi:MAG TPA: ABC transporter ATP-binding protein, partial [Anaerolineaceae bacterium]|nr:ABC transporter ATP-binding protein [Longilinea sp.]HOH19164.1 ABC transporter ATP-binding protein [Anaerolineaceae bacterium]HOU43059.1 ABC transporter ATP-binding protein [Anaerolineaceae bacterium]HPA33806.1 ABC transporter ATP-binding protein [Anaerolineaceae bacterium]HQF44554.1 ABC transporter ATP-binding protein [Anaerolineaceae bacterium]